MSHILVIDDDSQVRLMLRKILESEGYTVTDASVGKEGIECYRENQADLIITDIIMPEKEGIETIIELKKEYPDVKIIAMSGGGKISADNYLETAKIFGASRIMEKPFTQQAMVSIVKELLEDDLST